MIEFATVRILYHHRTQADDGQAVHIRGLVSALRARGHEVRECAVVPRAGGGGEAGPEAGWLRRVAAATPRPLYGFLELGYNVPARRRLEAEVRDFRPDLLYERYALNCFAGASVARRAGIPLFLEVNSPLALERKNEEGMPFFEFFRERESRLFREATRVLVVSEALQAEVCRQADLPPDRVVVIPNGVDLDRFDPEARGGEIRSSLGIAEDCFLLGFVGYVRSWHNLRLVVRVLRDQVLRSRKVDLLIVGDGPDVPHLLALAREGGIEGRIHVTGAVPHDRVPAYLAAFDVAVQPAAVPYASPLKLFEYMAAGKPIVAPEQPNVQEILTHGKDALLVKPGDVGGVALAILRLQGDPQLARRLGRQARRNLEARGFTWEKNVERVEALLEACRGGVRPTPAPAPAKA